MSIALILLAILGLSALSGMTYGPVAALLSELFPTRVRYTGSSLTFNLAGIFGASLAPYLATWLAQNAQGSPAGVILSKEGKSPGLVIDARGTPTPAGPIWLQ